MIHPDREKKRWDYAMAGGPLSEKLKPMEEVTLFVKCLYEMGKTGGWDRSAEADALSASLEK